MNSLIQVEEIPINVKLNSQFEINAKNLRYFTHSFFKYPCKFIPNIPRWAITKYTKEKDLILDCFAGSGTTLVEAVLLGRNALGVDFDKLSQLLCITKTNILSENEIDYIRANLPQYFKGIKINKNSYPQIKNLYHWFSQEAIEDLATIKANIYNITNQNIQNFLLVCFASIIRKCSYADDNSPKPYISKRFPKKPLPVKELFLKTVINNLKSFDKFSKYKLGSTKIISDDARVIKSSKLQNKIDLVITSPPYINAFDYVRSLRLENSWLGYYGDDDILPIKKQQIGTENISSLIYSEKIEKSNIVKLDLILKKIFKVDKKRAHVIYNYFSDMEKNICTIRNLLKTNAHYVIVVGDSKIRDVNIPTHDILIEIAERNGFKLDNVFSYIIKNRYLRIPRAGKGGLIKMDWVIDLLKI